MKNLFVLAVASLFATSASAAEMKWFGNTGWRINQLTNDDNLSSNVSGKNTSSIKTKSHALRANLGVTGGWENVEWGTSIRTSNGASNTDYVNLETGLDRAASFDQAWFRYLRDFGSLDLSVTVGRQMNVLASDDVSQTLFDKDARFDGLGWQFKFGMFGFNAAQYVTGARTVAAQGITAGTDGSSSYSYTAATVPGRKFNYLMAFQPHMTWKFSDEIETFFAVTFLHWSDPSNSNRNSGGVDPTVANTGTGSVSPVNSVLFRVHNPKQWHFYNTWTLPYNLNFQGELVINKRYTFDNNTVNGYAASLKPEASGTAWSLGLSYGSLKKAQDFTVGYQYGSKGLASVIGRYSNNLFLPDNKGHTLNAGYALADNFHLGAKAMFLKEMERINASGGATLAGKPYADATSRQEMRTDYVELTAGVMF